MEEKYHLIGIGGIGMGAIASLLLMKGYRVSGSDVVKNTMIVFLIDKGADVCIGHHERNIGGATCVVYSSAVSDQNVEMQAARKNGLKVMKRAELLAKLMKQFQTITVAGAHGKTTTTSMISHMLDVAQKSPTSFIGGIVHNSSLNAQLGDGQFFVAEVDESDGSFLYFHPRYSVITNIDQEHMDFYENVEQISQSYMSFINNTQEDGMVIACGDDPWLQRLLSKSNVKYMTYGFNANNDVVASDMTLVAHEDKVEHHCEYFTKFNCTAYGKTYENLQLALPGYHYVADALACISIGLKLQIDFDTICFSLKTYQGVVRRFQCLGNFNNIRVIDDYAHHPTEIKVTLQTAKAIKQGRLIVIFQPHRYSRTKYLWNDFVSCFDDTDKLIVTDIYAASEQPIAGISASVLCQEIVARKKLDACYRPKEDVINEVLLTAQSGDLILSMGAGDVTQLGHNLAKILRERMIDARIGA